MSNVKNFFKGLFSDEKGQTLTEYALILVLIAVVAVAVVSLLGNTIAGVFTSITGSL